MPPRRAEPRLAYYIVGLAVFLAIIAIDAMWTYRLQQQGVDAGWKNNLTELATVKTGELADWRGERNGDAAVAVAAAPLMPGIGAILAGTETVTERMRAMVWADALRMQYHYATVALADSAGRLRLTNGEAPARPDEWTPIALLAAHSPKVTWRDVSGPASDRRFLLIGMSFGGDHPAGTLLLAVDPAEVQSTVLRSRRAGSGHFSLVRRTHDGFVQLTPAPNAGSGANDNAVIGAALRNGLQDQGPVFAAVHLLANSDWAVVAMIDRADALAPMRSVNLRVSVVAISVILTGVIAVVLAWRHQKSTYTRQLALANQQRQALRQHYEFLLQFGNDAIFLLDGDGSILEVNDRAVEWYGYTRDELLGMHVSQLREEASGFGTTWDALRERRQVVFETLTRRKDGSLLPAEISIRLITTDAADGMPARDMAQSIVRDTSERHRADEQLRHVNRLYAVLSGCSQSMVDSRTQDELFSNVCRIATEVGGFRLALVSLVQEDSTALAVVARAGDAARYVEDLELSTEGELGSGTSGRSLREQQTVVCHDILAEPGMAPWHHIARSGGLRSSIAMPLRRRGRAIGVLSLYASESAFFDEAETRLAEEVADTVSFAIDSIDQERRRRQADAELRVNRDRLERVLDAIDEGYWEWRPLAGEIHLGARYHTMLGFEPGQRPFGWDAWIAASHPDDVPNVRAAFARFRNSREDALAVEHRLQCLSGAYLWIATIARVVERDASGEPTRIVGTQTDISERRKLEDQFVQAQKLESVGRLAGGVAHDFNNLLTVVNGYSELVLERMDGDDRIRPHIEAIQDAGQRASALTQQLLAFSRKQATQPRVMSLNVAIREFGRLLDRIVGDDVRIELRLEATADRIMADPSQVHQIIMNLVVNARDAMPAGGRITLSTFNGFAGDDDGAAPFPTVVLTIRDTGVGMSADTLAQIYEPFFTTKERGKGTGLGLSMVYGAVRQSAGTIDVDSALGQGTTFKIVWPQEIGDETPGVPAPASTRRGNATVLVVEDQSQVRRLAVDSLRSLGYTVIEAADAREALTAAERHHGTIDAMITDVIMPGMNGRALADIFAVERPAMKVLFSSGHTDDVLGEHGILRGDVAYLQKPYTVRTLSAKLEEMLNAGESGRPRVSTDKPVVLVVDDEESVRNLLAEVLAPRYRVLLAGDGIEAVEVIRRERRIDVVVLDLFMPRQEGLETIQAIREIRPSLRIVAMSGAFGGQFLTTAARAGVDATLVKPIQMEQLHGILDQILG